MVVNLVIEHLNDAEMRERRLFHEIERMADNPPPRWTKGTTKPIEMGRPFRSDVACRGDMVCRRHQGAAEAAGCRRRARPNLSLLSTLASQDFPGNAFQI